MMVASLIVSLLFSVPELEERPRMDDAFQAALVAAIHRFAEDGELDHLRAILDKYPRLVNAKQTFRQPRKPFWSDDYTALHRAAERGREEVVGLLIEKGADVNATANFDWTPLHVAAQSGKLSVVKRLVKAGAKVDARTVAVPEKFGIPPGSGPGERPRKIPAIPSLTPLEMAKDAKHPEVVEYLKAVGKKSEKPILRLQTSQSLQSFRKGKPLLFEGLAAVPIHRPGPEHFKIARVTDGETIFPNVDYDREQVEKRRPNQVRGARSTKAVLPYNHLFRGTRLFLYNGIFQAKDPMGQAGILDLYGCPELEPGVRYRLTWACWPVGANQAVEVSCEFELDK
jgi:hypothetical protein